MKKEELQAIRERVEQILTWSGEGGDIRHSDNWSEQRLRLLSLLEEDVPKLLDEIEQLQNIIRTYRLNEYRWQCSGCGHFQKYHNSRYRCENCKRENYLSGSFKREDLEKWFDERQAIGDES